MELMRVHYENTPMDMTQDLGAGPFHNGIRWRPLTWKVDGETYFNERAISTQQTGFSFVAQSRNWLPDPVGGILWFGVDDTYSTVYTPMYCGITEIPHAFAEGFGSLMEFEPDAAFWVFNQVSNFAYTRADLINPVIRKKQRELESGFLAETSEVDQIAKGMYENDSESARRFITRYSVNTGNQTVNEWKKFYGYLFTKYMDGNVKEPAKIPENYKYVTPKLKQPGYGEEWYKKIVNETGDKLKEPAGGGH
jgi:dipeptidase